MLNLVNMSKVKGDNRETLYITFSKGNEFINFSLDSVDNPEKFEAAISIMESEGSKASKTFQLYVIVGGSQSGAFSKINSDFYLTRYLLKSNLHNSIVLVSESGSTRSIPKAISDYMLSLLDETDTPIDEQAWKSIVLFLDNSRQNPNIVIGDSLFEWITKANQAGAGYSINSEGYIIGFQSARGSLSHPKAIMPSRAFVNGLEMQEADLNIGNIVKIPRIEVEQDVFGTGRVRSRSSQAELGPIVVTVKINPRDVVSIDETLSNLDIDVCEYTIIELAELQPNHHRPSPRAIIDERVELPITMDEIFNNEDWAIVEDVFDFEDVPRFTSLNIEEAERNLDNLIFIRYSRDNVEKYTEGRIVNVYKSMTKPGVVIKTNEDRYKHIKLDYILEWGIIPEEEETIPPAEEILIQLSRENWDHSMNLEQAQELLGYMVYIKYDIEEDKEFTGEVVDVYLDGENSGIIIESESSEFKHIKLHRITYWEIQSETRDLNTETTLEETSSQSSIDEFVWGLYNRENNN